MNKRLLKKLNNGCDISVLRLLNKNGRIYAHLNVLAMEYCIKWTDENINIIKDYINNNTLMFTDLSYKFYEEDDRELALVECNRSNREIHEGFRYWIDIKNITTDDYGDMFTYVYRDNLDFIGVYRLSKFNVVK